MKDRIIFSISVIASLLALVACGGRSASEETPVFVEEMSDTLSISAPRCTIDVLPVFNQPGFDSFSSWVEKKLVYPESSLKKEESGIVTASFVVSRTGKIGSVKIVEGVSPALNNEVKRVIGSSPRWEPAKTENGRAVAVECTICVSFNMK